MPSSLTIRSGTPEDFDACLALLTRFYAEEKLETTPAAMALPLQSLLEGKQGVVLLARDEKAPVGLAVLALSMGIEQGGPVAELTDLYVEPAFQKHGVGSLLITASIEWSVSQGCKRLQLVVTAESQATHDLIGYYQARQFGATGRTLLTRYL